MRYTYMTYIVIKKHLTINETHEGHTQISANINNHAVLQYTRLIEINKIRHE